MNLQSLHRRCSRTLDRSDTIVSRTLRRWFPESIIASPLKQAWVRGPDTLLQPCKPGRSREPARSNKCPGEKMSLIISIPSLCGTGRRWLLWLHVTSPMAGLCLLLTLRHNIGNDPNYTSAACPKEGNHYFHFFRFSFSTQQWVLSIGQTDETANGS